MANVKTISRIKESALFLGTESAQKARGYLDPPLELALKVIDCIPEKEETGATIEEIAQELQININTVRQILRALIQGEYPLLRESYTGYTKLRRGRPRDQMIRRPPKQMEHQPK